MTTARTTSSNLLLLGAATALPPLSIDMALPAISSVGAVLGSTSALAAQTIGLFILGFVLGPLLFGPLSDRIGRRPVMLGGLAVFTLAGIACAVAQSIEMLLIARVIQGAAAGAAAVMPVAIVRDAYTGREGRAMQNALVAINNVAPLVAPLIGATILLIGNWRDIYAALALAGLILIWAGLRLKESHPSSARSNHPLLPAYTKVLRNKRFAIAAPILALNFAGMFAYITASPLVFMEGMAMSSQGFAVLFAVTALGTLIGSWVNTRLIKAGWSESKVIGASLSISLLCSAGLLLASVGSANVIVFAALVVVSNVCTGLVMPNATHVALDELGQIAGSGAALLRALQMAGGAAASFLVGHFYDGHSANAMAGVMAGSALLGLVIFVLGYRRLSHHQPHDQHAY